MKVNVCRSGDKEYMERNDNEFNEAVRFRLCSDPPMLDNPLSGALYFDRFFVEVRLSCIDFSDIF